MNSGIYTITNKTNNKIYIGYASNFENRWNYHRGKLRLGCHDNIYLQRAWNKYGAENFIFEILVECTEQFLASEENYWANLLRVHNKKHGYNIRPTHPEDKAGNSEETKSKIREKRKLQVFEKVSIEKRKETRKKTIEANGYYFSEETIAKMSKLAKKRGNNRGSGWKQPDSFKKKMSKIMTGRKIPDYVRQKSSEYMKGKPSPMKGKKHTPEARQKIKEARAKQVITQEHKDAISKGNKGKSRNKKKL